MIPTEDNYAEWFTCSARFEFLRQGYAFLSFSLDQVDQPGFPSAVLLAAGSRIVGLQFLVPADDAGGSVPHAYVREEETARLMSAPAAGWLLYALPQSADPLDQQLTHQKVLFAEEVAIESDEHHRVVTAGASMTFKELVAGLEQGSRGLDVPQGYGTADLLAAIGSRPVTTYLALNQAARTVIVLDGGPQR